MSEEENIEKINLARIIDKFINENMADGWYAPELAQKIIDEGFHQNLK
jgi:hypothetical protein